MAGEKKNYSGLDMLGNQILNVGAAVNPGDVPNYGQLQGAVRGTDIKDACLVATTANITLSGLQTIDGVSVPANARVLVKNQTTASQNGLYNAATGAWTRCVDADADAEVTNGLSTAVMSGTTKGTGTTLATPIQYALTTADPIVVGSTALTFSVYAGGSAIATAGPGTVGWTFDYAATGVNPMSSGAVSGPFEVPFNCTLDPVFISQDDYHATVGTQFDIERFNKATGVWTSLWTSGTPPTLPAGQIMYKAPSPPTTNTLAKNDWIRSKLLVAPPTAGVNATAATHPFNKSLYVSSAKTTTHVVPMPISTDGATANDVVLVILSNGLFASATNPLPSPWVKVDSKATATGKINTTVIAAPWSAGLGTSVTFTADVQCYTEAFVILLRGVDISALGQILWSDGTEQTGGTITTPTGAAGNDADFLVMWTSTTFAPAVDNYTQDWTTITSGPAGNSKSVDGITAGGSTVIDYGFAGGFANAIAAGATVASKTITVTGGTGSLTNTTSLSGVLLLKRSIGHGPVTISNQYILVGV